MFDRFKKPKPETPSEDARPAPLPGGFGRRQSPIGSAPASDDAPPAAPTGGFGRRQVPVGAAAPGASAPQNTPQGAFENARQNAAGAAPGGAPKGDPSQGIAEWLMAELQDVRGVHCETILTVLGALAGFAAQQACWASADAFAKNPALVPNVISTTSGETFYFSELANQLLASTRKETPSVWAAISGAAKMAGADKLPDLMDAFSHTAKVVGSDQFGIPRLPARHRPRLLPRAAVDRYWSQARGRLEGHPPLMWPLAFGLAAARLIYQMKDACDPGLACHIVMEAAVPMSKIDPATVPK